MTCSLGPWLKPRPHADSGAIVAATLLFLPATVRTRACPVLTMGGEPGGRNQRVLPPATRTLKRLAADALTPVAPSEGVTDSTTTRVV